MASSVLPVTGAAALCWAPARVRTVTGVRCSVDHAPSTAFQVLPSRVAMAIVAGAAVLLTSSAQADASAMSGMSMSNFVPARYAGRWFEVASLKLGFAGQGQGDCHCTQGVYSLDEQSKGIEVDTFCVHGSPTGYMTGIRGKVQCVSDEELASLETPLEKMEMIREKCFLRFPSLPFIPKEPYDVLATDYENYALVSGARDTSFVQIYSRVPDPGQEFIDKYKAYLGTLGYNAAAIRDTPQDCEVMSMEQLQAMMSQPGMQQAMTNVFPSVELEQDVEIQPVVTSVWDTIKNLINLYL